MLVFGIDMFNEVGNLRMGEMRRKLRSNHRGSPDKFGYTRAVLFGMRH